MAKKTPWLTSDTLVDTVQKRIMFPISEVTFSPEDILNFASQEMFGTQVPSVLQYHEEYFINSISVPLQANVLRYPIPNRAIGMKLRYIFYIDTQNQKFDMTRINPNDQAFFLNASDGNNTPYKYYVENNDIVLPLGNITQPSGSLYMGFFMRPNQLVPNNQVATIQNFQTQITIDNTNIAPGDNLNIYNAPLNTSYVFTAVASSPGVMQFAIGGSSIQTATNMVNAINASNLIYIANNGTPGTSLINLNYFNISDQFLVSNSSSMIIPTTQTAVVDMIPVGFSNSTTYDIMQTLPGHRIINYDIPAGPNAISGNTITLPMGSFPYTCIIGDYIALANECIIPQLPPELHSILAERTCARILSSLGDTDGLNTANAKVSELETRQGNMVQNRVESNGQKVLNRKGLLALGKYSGRGPNN